MSRNIDSLKELLEKEDYTCVLSDGENIWTSREKGILPLVQFLRSDEDFFGGDGSGQDCRESSRVFICLYGNPGAVCAGSERRCIAGFKYLSNKSKL